MATPQPQGNPLEKIGGPFSLAEASKLTGMDVADVAEQEAQKADAFMREKLEGQERILCFAAVANAILQEIVGAYQANTRSQTLRSDPSFAGFIASLYADIKKQTQLEPGDIASIWKLAYRNGALDTNTLLPAIDSENKISAARGTIHTLPQIGAEQSVSLGGQTIRLLFPLLKRAREILLTDKR